MSQNTLYDKPENRGLPHIGQRITKTTVAVLLCLLFYYLRGYRGMAMPNEAAITAIICMQPYVRDTRDYALSRFAGTLVGSFWGLLFLLLTLFAPWLSEHLLLAYLLMALGVLLSLYSSVLIRRPDASGLAAIVFICIVISFPEIEEPLFQASQRILGVMLGTVIAIVVNVFRLPRAKNRNLVFFVRTKDLAADRFSQIPAAALFRLNYLYQDGAKICLMSEHAPAFFTLQMSEAMLSVPLIVMDGAAIYDAGSNEYLHVEHIARRDSAALSEHLKHLGISCFIYTVHKNKACIFHRGPVSEQEQVILDRMKRSPYRSYLEGDLLDPEEIVYYKIIAEDGRIESVHQLLQGFVHSRGLRAVVRPQAGAPGISGLYIYSEKATQRRAENKLMELLRREAPALEPVELFLRNGYHSERDAMFLLHILGNCYEPIKLFGKTISPYKNVPDI